MIKIHSFTFNAFQENTYVLYDETHECVIIDPGCYDTYEKQELTEFIIGKELKVVAILNTHCHVDHVLGNNFVKNFFKVKLAIPKLEEQVYRAVKVYASNYGFFQYDEAEIDEFINEEERLIFGNSYLEILFLPGHAPGHLGFYSPMQNFIIAGDVLFNGSIGRTDLPLGDYDTLISSIKNKLYKLPDHTIVYPGHGPETTVGIEKKSNPFVRAN